MISAFFVLALAAQAPAPPPTATAPAAAVVPAKLKVLVLDVNSVDLTESERTTLTNLEAAHLSEDERLEVLSGEDVKQLVKLQGQAQELGVDGNCTDACMAELAGALGAGVVVATHAGKLGETLVVTLVVFDAAKAKSVSRKSVQATSLGELPAKLGPALDALVKPLLPALPKAKQSASAVPRQEGEMSPRLRQLYDVEAMQVCFSAENRAAWWFCNRKQAFTENAFAREYRALLGSNDLERADVHRGISPLLPIGLYSLAGVGAVGLTGTLVCGLLQACGDELNETLSPTEALTGNLLFSISLAAVVGGIAGGIATSVQDPDGIKEMHVLTEGEGRGAINRYNAALRERLARDLGE